MSIKPEFSLKQIKETFKTNRFEIPKGAFVGRLYWADFAQYALTGVKLDGCYVIRDNKLRYHRVVEFVISSLETAQFLLRNCASPNLMGVRKATFTVFQQMKGWVGGAAQLLKPLKLATALAAKVKETVKSVIRPFSRYQPQSWDKCQTVEQVQYLFDRCPSAQRTDRFVSNYVSALERVSPVAESVVSNLSLDDVVQVDYVPGEVQLEAVKVEHIPASEDKVRKMFAEAFSKNKARCKQWIIGVGRAIPGYEILVKGSDKRTAPKIMEQVIQNVLLAGLSVQELSCILAA